MPPVSLTACTEPQCLYKGALYLFTIQNVRGQSIKKPYFCNSEPTGARSMLAMVALCSGDFKFYSDMSSITPRQLVIEPQLLERVCV